MNLLVSRREAGLAALTDLERTRYACYLDQLGTTRTWGAESSKDAALSYFGKTCVSALDALRRRLDALDDSGWERWVADADSLYRDMADVAGYRREWSLRGVLLDTGKKTARDIGTAAQTVVKNAGTGAGVFGFLLAAFVAWKVLR